MTWWRKNSPAVKAANAEKQQREARTRAAIDKAARWIVATTRARAARRD